MHAMLFNLIFLYNSNKITKIVVLNLNMYFEYLEHMRILPSVCYD